MIKLAIITPSKFIKKYGEQGSFHLALAHLIDLKEENEYEKALCKTRKTIFLDNGLFENHTPEPTSSLIKKALKIAAEVVFAPDVLFNPKKTQEELNSFIEELRKQKVRSVFRVAAVPQAKSRTDYINQLLSFNNNKNVDIIGLSILSIPKSYRLPITEARIELMKKMIELNKDGVIWKDCHLLGLGDSYKDVLFAKQYCPWVKTNDTSCCFQSGLKGKVLTKKLEVPGGKVKEKVDFELDTLTKKQKDDIQKNISRVKKAIK